MTTTVVVATVIAFLVACTLLLMAIAWLSGLSVLPMEVEAVCRWLRGRREPSLSQVVMKRVRCIRCRRLVASHACPIESTLATTAVETVAIPAELRDVYRTLLCELCGARVILHRCPT